MALTFYCFHAMTSIPVPASQRNLLSNSMVSSDFMALASHMSDCQRSQSRFFGLRTQLENLHALTSCRLVTTGVVLASCLGLAGFALLNLV